MSKTPRVIKVCDRYGLCNRLFPFAHLIASSCEYGWELVHRGFDGFEDFFEGTKGLKTPVMHFQDGKMGTRSNWLDARIFDVQLRISKRLRWHRHLLLNDSEICDMSTTQIRQLVESARVTQLSGLYFFNPIAFRKWNGLVRSFFQPVAEIESRAKNRVARLREICDVVVGVHIRHGDYENFCNGMMFYPVAEYVALMFRACDLFPGQRVGFLVCSNVPLEKSDYSGLQVSMGSGEVVEDLRVLSLCDYLIGPSSTFTEWASFYGEVPRYVHRRKDYELQGQQWPGLKLVDFEVHRDGFGRCNPGHPASLAPATV